MAKSQDAKKNVKKAPQKTAKEKKLAKREKKMAKKQLINGRGGVFPCQPRLSKLVSVQRSEHLINANKNLGLSQKMQFILNRIKRHLVERVALT